MLALAVPTRSRYWPTHSSIRSSSNTARATGGAFPNSWSAYTKAKSPIEDRRAVTEAAVLAPPGHCVVAVEEGPVHGRQPTAQRRAVHDVVVHEGERVQQLERGAGVDHDLVGRVAPGAHEGPVAERGPQPLAAGADEVEQGSQRCVEVGVDPGPAVDLPADQVVDAPLDRVADLGQARGGTRGASPIDPVVHRPIVGPSPGP